MLLNRLKVKQEKQKKSFFVPDLILPDISKLSVQYLHNHGIKAVILDVDNTLTLHGSQKLSDAVSIWLSEMKKRNFPMMIVSNNTKKRITPFAALIGLPFVSMSLKPMRMGYRRAQKAFGVKANEIAVVGDQIFTDVLGGNCVGMHTVLVMPIQIEGGFTFRLRRNLEKKHINRYYINNQ